MAELSFFFGKAARVVENVDNFAVVDLFFEVNDFDELLAQMGGVKKIMRLLEYSDVSSLSDDLVEILKRKALGNDFKFDYALSVYNMGSEDEKILKNLLKTTKSALRELGISCRFLNKPGMNVSDVTVVKEGLIAKGADFVVLGGESGVMILETVAVQDFEAYSLRDYKRPRRNPKRGMLPPKLAQMMINVSGMNEFSEKEFLRMDEFLGGGHVSSKGVIYDPFCGNGTLLMEAMLMGFDVIGSDISPESVMDSRINLAWLKEKFPDVRKRNFQVFRSDVTALKDEDVQKALNGLVGGGVKMEELKAVVTESYLGPPVETEPHVEKCAQVDEDLSYLHKKGFEAFAKIFPEVPVVMTLPFYRLRSGAYEMKKTVEKISSVGYYCQALLPRERSIFYARDDQIVGRQLFRFKRK